MDEEEPEQVTVTSSSPDTGYFPDYSPDGLWLLFQRRNEYWRIPVSQGEPELVSPGPGQMGVWSPDGKAIYYTGWLERAGNLWTLSPENGREFPMTDFVGRRGTLGWGKATDGKYVYFTWWEDLGDIWVMDVVTDESE